MPMGLLLLVNSMIKQENGLKFMTNMEILSFASSAITVTKYMVILIKKLLQTDAEILNY